MHTRGFLSGASSSSQQKKRTEAYRNKLHASSQKAAHLPIDSLISNRPGPTTIDRRLQDFPETRKDYKNTTENHKQNTDHSLLDVFYNEILKDSFEIKGISPHSPLNVFLLDFSYKKDKQSIDNEMFERFLNSSLSLYPALNLQHSALNADVGKLKQIINREFLQETTFFYLLHTTDTNNEYQMKNKKGALLCGSYIFFVKTYLELVQTIPRANSLFENEKEDTKSNQIHQKSNTERSSFLNILKAYDELIEQDFTYVLYLLDNWTRRTNKENTLDDIKIFLSTEKQLCNGNLFYKNIFYKFNYILSNPNDITYLEIGESICLIGKDKVVDINRIETKLVDGLENLKKIYTYLENFDTRTATQDIDCSRALQILSDNIYFQNLKSPEKSLLMKKISCLFSDKFNEYKL